MGQTGGIAPCAPPDLPSATEPSPSSRPFTDRVDAGRQLAARLTHLAAVDDSARPVVAGLPRGGVPVAAQVASVLGAPLDIIVVRKLGAPSRPELAIGAIGENGIRVINQEVVDQLAIADDVLAAVTAREQIELDRRSRRYRGSRARIELDGRVVVIVDDGLATGSTARAACRLARAEGAERVVLAVPVAPADWADRLAGEADELVAVETAESFVAVGSFYDDFTPTGDDEVLALLGGR